MTMPGRNATLGQPQEDSPAARGETEAGRTRLKLYGLCLIVSFALFTVVHGLAAGLAGIVCCAVVLLALSIAVLASAAMPGLAVLIVCGAAGAAVAALTFPLMISVFSGQSLPAAVRSTTVWPQILVTLFASRLIAEQCDLSFAAFWRDPMQPGHHHARTQSMLAAAILGLCLALVFYQLSQTFSVEAARLDPVAIAWRALTGETAVHVFIVVLFFLVIAAILDAALLSLHDGAVLDALRRLCRARLAAGVALKRKDVTDLARSRLALFSHSRAIQCVRDASENGAHRREGQGRAPLESFHAASRRLIRALLSFLPLLGFLGTVIGLTAAIGSLPTDFGPGSGATMDISGSLSGLALKFETTLLGLAGGLVASLLLALVERREAELSAQCSRLVEAIAHDG